MTIVGRGTHGLGPKAEELHKHFNKIVYEEWKEKKKEEQAAARNRTPSPDEQQLSPRERLEWDKHQLALRAYEKEMRAKKLADEFARERQKLKEEIRKQKADEEEFVHVYSEDNVKEAQEQLSTQRERRKRLETLRLPDLDERRREMREEKERWDDLTFEQRYEEDQKKAARRQYILDMKAISARNYDDSVEERRRVVEEQRRWLRDKLDQRAAERNKQKEESHERIEVMRQDLRLKVKKSVYQTHIEKQKYVEKRVEENKSLSEPILTDREAALNQHRQEVASRCAERKGTSTARGQFESERKALADDLRAETARHRREVEWERDSILREKKALHEEGLKDAMRRQQALSERRERIKQSAQATRSPRRNQTADGSNKLPLIREGETF